ncbi:MAG: hypothetical protein KDE14_04965, partial [Rhodobacteraceae bacterium]|nr:hypothetical protein [Paracoccaceae bacterium]
MQISRRSLLSAASFAPAMGLVSPGLRVALAAEGSSQNDILVVIYLRGGSDGLQMVAPAGDPNYIAARPTIAVPTSGPGAGYGIATHQGVDFFINPDAPELRDLFSAGDLAVVHAVGIPNGKRSHFESQDQMELGVTPDDVMPNDGWLTRHIAALGGDRPLLGTVASAPNMPISLLGYTSGLAIPEVTTFNVVGGATTAGQLRNITSGTSVYKSVATNTLDAIATIQDGLLATANDPNAQYSGPIGNALKSLARLIKMDVGLDLATVDHHGWDHHDNLLSEFQDRTVDLSKS